MQRQGAQKYECKEEQRGGDKEKAEEKVLECRRQDGEDKGRQREDRKETKEGVFLRAHTDVLYRCVFHADIQRSAHTHMCMYCLSSRLHLHPIKLP